MMHRRLEGFSLIELILYIGITSTVLMAISLLLFQTFGSRARQQVISEVDQQGAQVMRLVTQALRNAETINAPLLGASAAALSIHMLNPSIDPTVVDLSSGIIRMTEGAGAVTALTNSRVTATNLQFQNLSLSNTPGTVRLSFTLTYVNPGGRAEYAYTKTFVASASLR